MDIVVIGGVLSWDTMEGQRASQLVREFPKMGHNVLYIAAERSRNQQTFKTANFQVVSVLPRFWPFYDMESTSASSRNIVERTMKHYEARRDE